MSCNESYLKHFTLKNDMQLTVRKAVPEDASNMIEYLNMVGGESDNLLFGKDEFYFTVEQEIEYINKISTDPSKFMIVGIVNDTLASVAQISCPDRKRICHNSELAISVRKEFWGIGIGTAIMGELLHYAKENPEIKNVSLGVRAGNTAAIWLYEKCGFVKVGTHKDYFHINGTYEDEILMDLYFSP